MVRTNQSFRVCVMLLMSAVFAGRFSASIKHSPQSIIEQIEQPVHQFKLGQDTSSYDGYIPLKPAYTTTDGYAKLDSFFIGLALDTFYEYSDDCLNSLVYTVNDYDYLRNNMTLYKSANENFIHPLLNFTGLLGSNLADSLPNCYQFLDSVKTVETTRFDSYSGWGDIAIAFLFNQMGNALAF